MEKVLVTGGCGFIGSHIVDRLLSQNYNVAVFDNLSTGSTENIDRDNVTFYYGDILGEELDSAFEQFKPDYVIHLAAQVSVQQSIVDCYHDSEINIQGTINIVNCSKKHETKKIIFASSAAVYGNKAISPVNISSLTQPDSPYGLSKLTAEEYLKLAKQLYDIDYVILRYSNVYGPRQNAHGEGGVISIFVTKLLEHNQPIIFGDGEQTRDFVFVKDVAAANLKALEHDGCGVFNISTNSSVSINQLLQTISQIGESNVLPLYETARKGEIRDSLLCNKESITDLQWSPMYSLEEGLEDTWKYYVNSKNVYSGSGKGI